MSLPALSPDAELVARTYLAAVAEVAAIVGTDTRGEPRVYTIVPKPVPDGPFVRLRRLPSPPRSLDRRWLDAAALQIDAYGGSKRTANRLMETVRAALEQLPDLAAAGTVTPADGAVIAGVEFGPMGYLPDPDLLTERSGARERFVADITLVLHPARTL